MRSGYETAPGTFLEIRRFWRVDQALEAERVVTEDMMKVVLLVRTIDNSSSQEARTGTSRPEKTADGRNQNSVRAGPVVEISREGVLAVVVCVSSSSAWQMSGSGVNYRVIYEKK